MLSLHVESTEQKERRNLANDKRMAKTTVVLTLLLYTKWGGGEFLI